MEQARPDAPYSAAAVQEGVRHLSVSSLQLLVMLDVVYDWDRGDAIEVGVSAAQTESMARSVSSVHLRPGRSELERLLHTLDSVIVRAERLARLAPVQSRDDACAGAMAGALRRLAAASDELRGQLAATAFSAAPEPDGAPGA